MNYEEENFSVVDAALEGAEDFDTAKEALASIIDEASARLEEIEEASEEIAELSDDEEEDVEGAGRPTVGWKKGTRSTSGTMRGGTRSECIQSVYVLGGACSKIQNVSASKNGLKLFKKGSYVYAERSSASITGKVTGKAICNRNDVNITWYFK